jgi:hypothetical protein
MGIPDTRGMAESDSPSPNKPEEIRVEVHFATAQTVPACFAPVCEGLAKEKNVDAKGSVALYDSIVDAKSGKKLVLCVPVSDKKELSAAVEAILSCREQISGRKLVPIVFLKSPNPKVEDLLLRAGCMEILKYDLPVRTLQYKLNRLVKALAVREPAGDDSVEVIRQGGEHGGDKSVHRSGIRTGTGDPEKIDFLDPLDTDKDIWLIRRKNHVKFVQKQFLVEIIGPSPAAGDWVPAELYKSLFPNAPELWAWKPRAHADVFDPSPETWVFIGRKPVYSWVVNRWSFVGETPALHLFKLKTIIASRFLVDDASVDMFPEMKLTFDREYIIKNDLMEILRDDLMREDDPAIKWADRIDSRTIPDHEWKSGDLAPDAGMEINNRLKPSGKGGAGINNKLGSNASAKPVTAKEAEAELIDAIRAELAEVQNDASEREGAVLDEALEKDPSHFRFKSGFEAMEACGLTTSIGGIDFELVGFNPESKEMFLATGEAPLKIGETSEILLAAENLDLPDRYSIPVRVERVISNPDETRVWVVRLLDQKGVLDVKKAQEAVLKRQAEIFAFFKQAKGW